MEVCTALCVAGSASSARASCSVAAGGMTDSTISAILMAVGTAADMRASSDRGPTAAGMVAWSAGEVPRGGGGGDVVWGRESKKVQGCLGRSGVVRKLVGGGGGV